MGQQFWARRSAGGRPEPDDGAAAEVTRLRVVAEDAYADWEAVYNDNVERVYRMLFAKVGNRPDAEDLTAEVFAAALRPLRLSSSIGEVRAYLFATARTVLAAYWRRTMGRQITVLPEDWPLAEPDDGVAAASTVAVAEAILAGLPNRYRRILELRFLGACSLADAAEEMGISVGNAKVLQHRALRRAATVAERMEW